MFAVVAACVLGVTASGQADELRNVVERTLTTSPDMGIVIEGRRAAAFEVDQAGGLFLPTVDLRTTAGEQYSNDQTSRNNAALSGKSRTVGLPRYEAGLTLRQLLFDGEESESEYALRTARRKSASRRVLQTSVGVALDAVEAYLESLRHRELVELAKETIAAHEQTLDQVEEMAAGGAVGVADVKQAESRLSRAQDDFAQARNRMNDADAAYRRIVGEPVAGLVRPQVPESALPVSIAIAVNLAVESNAAVKVAKSELDEAKAEYRKSRSNYFPRVNLEVSANSSRNLDGARGSEADVSALVVMNYNLYRGGADVALRQSLIARQAESLQRLNRAVRLVEEQARLSWNALRNGRDRVLALRNQVQANQVVRATYREQFDLNQRSLLDLLDSENDLFVARANLITSEFAVMFGVYRVLGTTGQLLDALGVQAPLEALDAGVEERSVPTARPAARAKPLPAAALPSPLKLPPSSNRPSVGPAGTVAAGIPVREARPRPESLVGTASPVVVDAPHPPVRSAVQVPSILPGDAKLSGSVQAIQESAVPLYWGFN